MLLGNVHKNYNYHPCYSWSDSPHFKHRSECLRSRFSQKYDMVRWSVLCLDNDVHAEHIQNSVEWGCSETIMENWIK